MKNSNICLGLIAIFSTFSTTFLNVYAFIPEGSDTTARYRNPVFAPSMADPTIIRDSATGIFYALSTCDNWGDEGGRQIVPAIKSTDLVHWELVGSSFIIPEWINKDPEAINPNCKENCKGSRSIWAPNIMRRNNKFYIFYAYSRWDDSNPGIGMAKASTPYGPFTDYGKILDSRNSGVSNSIDPFVFNNNGNYFLIWGSFKGIYGYNLEFYSNGDSVRTKGDKVKIAGNSFEAPYIYKKYNKYYLFASVGTCCEGARSNYKVTVGRSDNLTGPYIDQYGNNMLDMNKWDEVPSYVLVGNEKFAGPGHNGEIITDDNGDDWFLYHAIDRNIPRFIYRGKMSERGVRRPLMLDKIIWVNEWPVINNGKGPGIDFQALPIFRN
jgi:arabinan endo-1,5-alpha-L-arabinosidase